MIGAVIGAGLCDDWGRALRYVRDWGRDWGRALRYVIGAGL